mmetsp:Transcript_26282/g.52740  ORF Transcript_26282/g.52740 Transcript_26282/m.52740 type:complete len:114 (-) Transcript_26282:671-1012(-)
MCMTSPPAGSCSLFALHMSSNCIPTVSQLMTLHCDVGMVVEVEVHCCIEVMAEVEAKAMAEAMGAKVALRTKVALRAAVKAAMLSRLCCSAHRGCAFPFGGKTWYLPLFLDTT